LQETLQEQKEKIYSLTEANVKAVKAESELKKNLADQKRSIGQLSRERILKMEQENAKLQKQVDKCEREVEYKKEKLQKEAEESLEKIKKKVSEDNGASFWKEQIAQLNQELSLMKESISSALTLTLTLTLTLSLMKESVSSASTLRKSLSQVQTELKKKDDENSRLKEKLITYEEEDRSLFWDGAEDGCWAGSGRVQLQGHEITPSGFMLYELEQDHVRLKAEVLVLEEEIARKDTFLERLQDRSQGYKDEAATMKTRFDRIRKTRDSEVSSITKCTTKMWHKDLSALTQVFETKANEASRLILGGEQAVQDEYHRIVALLAPKLDYPIPSRTPEERAIIEEHVRLQARVVVELGMFQAKAGGGKASAESQAAG